MKRFLITLLILLSIFLLSNSAYAQTAPATKPDAQHAKHVFSVNGLACPYCAIQIKKGFMKMKGFESFSYSIKNGTVTIMTEPGVCFTSSQLKELINKGHGNIKTSLKGVIIQPQNCGPESQ